MDEFKVGDRVQYESTTGRPVIGVIEEIRRDGDIVWAVMRKESNGKHDYPKLAWLTRLAPAGVEAIES